MARAPRSARLRGADPVAQSIGDGTFEVISGAAPVITEGLKGHRADAAQTRTEDQENVSPVRQSARRAGLRSARRPEGPSEPVQSEKQPDTARTARKARSPPVRIGAIGTAAMGSPEPASAAHTIGSDVQGSTAAVRSAASGQQKESESPPGATADDMHDGSDDAAEWSADAPPADASGGQVLWIELVDFMCHRHLLFRLGPRVNFLVGANGSGKSAVLAGLAVCLGARAARTQRADAAGDLVREGASSATVRVAVANSTDAPYAGAPPDAAAIVVERVLRRGGASAYRVYAEGPSGRALIGRRADDAQAVCEHFGLLVESPLVVLTQETAKRFLAAARPPELYALFSAGTQLEQLRADYAHASGRMAAARDALVSARAGMDAAAAGCAALRMRLAELEGLRVLHGRIRRAERRLGRMLVAEARAQLAAACARRDEAARHLAEAQRRAMDATAALDAARRKREAAEAAASATGRDTIARAVADASSAVAALQRQAATLREDVADAARQRDEREAEALRCTQRAESLARRGGPSESARGPSASADSDALASELQALNARLEALGEDARTCEDQVSDSIGRERDAQSAFAEAERRARGAAAAQRAATAAQDDRLRILGAVSGPAAGAGERMAAALAEIGRTRFSLPPVGPLGLHVSLRDGRWAAAVDAVLQGMLDAFVVNDHDDAARLRAILERHRLGCPIVKLSFAAAQTLDTSAGRPDASLATVNSALEVSSDVARFALVTMRGIERAVLVADRQTATELARRRMPNVAAIYTPGLRIRAGAKSVSTSVLVPSPAAALFSSAAERAADLQAAVDAAEHEVRESSRALRLAAQSTVDAETRRDATRAALREAEGRVRDVRAALRAAEDARLAARQPGAGAEAFARSEAARLRDTIAEIEAERIRLASQLEAVLAQLSAAERRAQDARAQAADAEARRAALAEDLRAADAAAVRAAAEHTASLAAVQRAQRVLDETHGGVSAAESQLSAVLASSASRMASASQADIRSGEDMDVDSGPDHMDQVSHESTGSDEEDIHISTTTASRPGTIQEAQAELEELRARAAARMAAGNVEDPHALRAQLVALSAQQERARLCAEANEAALAALSAVLEDRQRVWADMRRGICLKSAVEFAFLLLVRQFAGSLDYDHDARELRISVAPHAASGGAAAPAQDVRQLSGGERSYATMCFLCSLWPAVGSPFRALDEFDVYMDAVNRGMVLGALLSAARQSALQFLLITPNSIPAELLDAPDVRLHTLAPPVRSAQTAS